jgi:hypothetical protein
MYFSQRGQLGKICEGILLAKFFCNNGGYIFFYDYNADV